MSWLLQLGVTVDIIKVAEKNCHESNYVCFSIPAGLFYQTIITYNWWNFRLKLFKLSIEFTLINCRVENLNKFRNEEGDCPTLVCTDLAARGLDLDVDHVIMFDFPSNSVRVDFLCYFFFLCSVHHFSHPQGNWYAFFSCIFFLFRLITSIELEEQHAWEPKVQSSETKILNASNHFVSSITSLLILHWTC